MQSGQGGVLFSYEATCSQPQLTAAFRVSPTKLVPLLLSPFLQGHLGDLVEYTRLSVFEPSTPPLLTRARPVHLCTSACNLPCVPSSAASQRSLSATLARAPCSPNGPCL